MSVQLAFDVEMINFLKVTFHDSKTLEIRRAYYACVSFADQQIGRVSDNCLRKNIDSVGTA